MITPKTYSELNQSFEKCMVFHLGSRAGFFSEYNCMILGMIYCIQKGIRFDLYSKDTNFSNGGGWTDLFMPFTNERTMFLHRLLNYRFPKPGIKFALRKYLGGTILKRIDRCDYLTYDLWNSLRAQDYKQQDISIPDLGWSGNFRELCGEMVNLTWRLNVACQRDIDAIITSNGIPKEYLGIHLRRGDKIKENEFISHHHYMDKIQSSSDLKDVFVMSDDFQAIRLLIDDYPAFRFHTLELPNQQGHVHRKKRRMPPSERRDHYLRFVAGIECLARASIFAGTFSSNIGVFLGMRMQPERCMGVDFDEWRIW